MKAVEKYGSFERFLSLSKKVQAGLVWKSLNESLNKNEDAPDRRSTKTDI